MNEVKRTTAEADALRKRRDDENAMPKCPRCGRRNQVRCVRRRVKMRD